MLKDYLKYFVNYQVRFSPLFWQRFKKVKELKTNEGRELDDIRNEAFLKLFRNAMKKSFFYKQLYKEYGIGLQDIKTIEDINKLPIITKELIRSRIDDVLIGSRRFKTLGMTSGTTGTPLKVYRDYNSVLNEAAFTWAQRDVFGYLPGMKTISLRGDLSRSDLFKFDSYGNTLFLSSYNLKEENAALFYEKISSFSPYAILAYPSSVYILANFFKNVGKDLHVPYIFTSSETLYDFQRETIEDVFNCKVVDWYGNAERTIAIEQLKDGKYYDIPLYSINEYQPDCTITTGLINFSFPMIRYQVNDIILPGIEVIGKAREIKKLTGRVDDILILWDGTRVGRMDVVFKGVENLDFAQFVQNTKENFKLNLVTSPGFSAKDEKLLINNLKKRVGELSAFELNFVSKNDIIFSKANKYKLVINKVQE